MDSHAETPWNAPAEEIQRAQSFVTNELVISGIYVRLFIANPGWVLRKPREFLSDLLENALQSMQSSNPNLESLETITTALVKLLEAQPALADMVPATGYISRILSSISNLDNKFQKPGVLMINTISRYTFVKHFCGIILLNNMLSLQIYCVRGSFSQMRNDSTAKACHEFEK